MKKKILKIKIGDVFINGRNYPIMQTAFQRVSKDGKTTYFETRNQIFMQEINTK